MLEILNILLKIAQIAAVVVVIAWAAVRMIPKKECLCDKCENLALKRKRNRERWRYVCAKWEKGKGFDTPPEYCWYFEERKNDENT